MHAFNSSVLQVLKMAFSEAVDCGSIFPSSIILLNVVELDSMKLIEKRPFKNRRMRPLESSFQKTQRQCRSTEATWEKKEPALSS